MSRDPVGDLMREAWEKAGSRPNVAWLISDRVRRFVRRKSLYARKTLARNRRYRRAVHRAHRRATR